MMTKMTHATLATLAVFALLAGLPGCIDNAKSLVIVAAVPYTADDMPDLGSPPSCNAPLQDPEGEFSYQPSGLLDLNYPGFGGQPTYAVHVQVHNYIVNNSNEDNGINNSNTIQLERFEVRYKWLIGRELLEDTQLFPGGQALLFIEDQKVSSPTSGVVYAADKIDEPGRTMSYVIAVPGPLIGSNLVSMTAAYVDSLVLGVKVRVIGRTLGGSRVESNEFVFPIYFCWGCHTCPGGTTYASCTPGADGQWFCIAPDAGP